jgi:transposase
MSAEGQNNRKQARQLGVYYQRVRRWRKKWAQAEKRLSEAENQCANNRDLVTIISEVLSDDPRPGGPTKFSAEQLVQIISVACEPPEDSDRPVTHWTPKELAAEVVKRKIVESISPRHIDRFLKKKRPPTAQKPVLDDLERQT